MLQCGSGTEVSLWGPAEGSGRQGFSMQMGPRLEDLGSLRTRGGGGVVEVEVSEMRVTWRDG